MQLRFRGWSRETKIHEHDLQPVQKIGKAFFQKDEATFKERDDKFVSFQKASDLALSGQFLVEIVLEREEIIRYMHLVIDDDPQEAIEFLHGMLGKATMQAISEQRL